MYIVKLIFKCIYSKIPSFWCTFIDDVMGTSHCPNNEDKMGNQKKKCSFSHGAYILVEETEEN